MLTGLSAMQLLTLLLVAVPTAVFAMRPDIQCEIDDPTFLAMRECKRVLRPPMEAVMSHIMCVVQDQFINEYEGLISPVMARMIQRIQNGKHHMHMHMRKGPEMFMCFHTRFNNMTDGLRANFSSCVLDNNGMLTPEGTLDTTKFLEEVTAMAQSAAIPEVAEVLQAAIDTGCPLPSETPDLATIVAFKKCLMKKCLLYALNEAEPM